jgi:hypothetical protein
VILAWTQGAHFRLHLDGATAGGRLPSSQLRQAIAAPLSSGYGSFDYVTATITADACPRTDVVDVMAEIAEDAAHNDALHGPPSGNCCAHTRGGGEVADDACPCGRLRRNRVGDRQTAQWAGADTQRGCDDVRTPEKLTTVCRNSGGDPVRRPGV